MFTHYEDMKGMQNVEIGGSLGVDRAHILGPYSTLMDTMRLSCAIFEL